MVESSSDTIVAGMLLSLIYLRLIHLLQPFTDPGLNRIKETSIWQIFFVFLIALLLKTNAMDSDLLTTWLLLVFFANFILLLGQYLAQYWLRHAACVCVSRGVTRRASDVEAACVMDMEKDLLCTLTSMRRIWIYLDLDRDERTSQWGLCEEGTVTQGPSSCSRDDEDRPDEQTQDTQETQETEEAQTLSPLHAP